MASQLKKQFATNKVAEAQGVAVEMYGSTFVLARMSRTNRKFAAASEAAIRPYMKDISAGKSLPADKSAEINLDVFCETVLVGWKNVEYDSDIFPNLDEARAGVYEELDQDTGKSVKFVPYSKENAYILMSTLNDLYDELVSKASSIELFRLQTADEIAGK